jgi:hypothetical protein
MSTLAARPFVDRDPRVLQSSNIIITNFLDAYEYYVGNLRKRGRYDHSMTTSGLIRIVSAINTLSAYSHFFFISALGIALISFTTNGILYDASLLKSEHATGGVGQSDGSHISATAIMRVGRANDVP